MRESPIPFHAQDLGEKGFRHRGLQRLYEKGVRKGLNPGHLKKIERILARLDEASEPGHLDLPGYRLHPLKGELVGFWSVTVAANWRIIFRFAQGDVLDVDYVDYH
jgi:proteic killer suppression protein